MNVYLYMCTCTYLIFVKTYTHNCIDILVYLQSYLCTYVHAVYLYTCICMYSHIHILTFFQSFNGLSTRIFPGAKSKKSDNC